MKCELCHQRTPSLLRLRVYTPQGIEVCGECYKTIDSQRHKPFSKVMDRLALVEAGYYANRKLARIRS